MIPNNPREFDITLREKVQVRGGLAGSNLMGISEPQSSSGWLTSIASLTRILTSNMSVGHRGAVIMQKPGHTV